jgi:hypothetical protein
MAIESLWCLVRHTIVERVVDDEGRVVAVVCPEFDCRLSTCHLKAGALTDEQLSQLVEHAPDHPLQHPAGRCVLL